MPAMEKPSTAQWWMLPTLRIDALYGKNESKEASDWKGSRNMSICIQREFGWIEKEVRDGDQHRGHDVQRSKGVEHGVVAA